jgi:thioredoxin 1
MHNKRLKTEKMKTTLEINDTNFESEVLQSSVPVLVDFWAEWCGPCKMLVPALEEIATEQAGRVKIAQVNVDENPTLAQRFGIQSIPTLLYFANGRLRNKTIGAVSKKRMVDTLGAGGFDLTCGIVQTKEDFLNLVGNKPVLVTRNQRDFASAHEWRSENPK